MKYYLKSKSVPVVLGDGWLVNIEKRAFGWKPDGAHDEEYEYDEHTTRNYTEYHDGIEWDVTEHRTERKTGITTYQDFYRISPFTFNPFFALLELFSGIFSFIRRLVMSLVAYLWYLIIGLVVIGCILDPSMVGDAIYVVVGCLAIYFFVVVVPSLLIALVAVIMRKLFGIDKNLEESLRRNGYRVDW